MDEGEKQGSSSCVEVFEAAIDELHRSFRVLRRLSSRNFDAQMGDLTMWVSPALSDEDTCIEGFEGERGKVVNLLKNQAVKVVLSRVMH